MSRTAIAAAVCFASISPGLRAEEKPVHFFILSGQSNMAGMRPEAGFVPEAETCFPGAEVRFLKVARGGQPIRHWVGGWNAIAEAAGKTQRIGSPVFYERILEGYRAATEGKPAPASVTFCWMQGERDAKEGLDGVYREALETLIADLRRDLGRPEMKVVVARLSDHFDGGNAAWDAVRAAQVAVAEADLHGAWVDCDDLNDKLKGGKAHNDLHYTAEGYATLGRRYARQALALIEGREPAGDGRPAAAAQSPTDKGADPR